MSLSEERKNEIAMLFIKHRVRKGGLALADVKREVGNIAKEVGITTEEAMEFIEPIYREVIDEVFGKDSKRRIGFKNDENNQCDSGERNFLNR